MAHLLHEFLLEVRHRWESGHCLPGVPEGAPDTAQGLLNQKLQVKKRGEGILVDDCYKKTWHIQSKNHFSYDQNVIF